MNEEEITKLLDLARLELSKNEITELAQQFGDMLKFVGQVNSAAQNIKLEPMVLKSKLELREDFVNPQVIQGSEYIHPNQEVSQREFIVPRIVGGELKDE